MPQVTCLGILVADIVGRPIDHMPALGTLISTERIELHTGGCAANTGISLAKLGVETEIIGKVGCDTLGEQLVSDIVRAGAGVSAVVRARSGEPTSATMVMVDPSGERSFIHCPGANATFDKAEVDWSVVRSSPILHIAGPFLMTHFIGQQCAEVLKQAKEYGLTTTLDTVWDFTGRWLDVFAPSLPYIDYALPSLEEAKMITGKETPYDIAGFLLDHGVKVAAIKLGADGSYLRTASDELLVPPLKVVAVDSLGAGDAWSAGFLCGLVRGWDFGRILTFANAVGACCVQALGSTTGIRSFDETYKFAFGSKS